MVISETKLDDSFPEKKVFLTNSFRLRSEREITTNFSSFEDKPIEALFIELNFRKNKWLLSSLYNPNKNNILNHLQRFRNSLYLYSAKYENITLIGEFNVSLEDSHMEEFCESYGLKNLIKVPTCHKNPPNPSCTNLTLTNNPLSFQSSGAIEIGLSDFHKMIVTVMKATFQKLDPKIMHCRDYRKYNNYSFRQDLLYTKIMEHINLGNGFQKFIDI